MFDEVPFPLPSNPDEIQINQPTMQSVRLVLTSGMNNDIGGGTGFIVKHNSDAYLITCHHVLSGKHQVTGATLDPNNALPASVKIFHHDKGKFGDFVVVEEPLFDDQDAPRWLEHPRGSAVDVVALKLSDSLDSIDLYPHSVVGMMGHGARELSAAPRIASGTDAFVIGFPFGMAVAGTLPIWTRATLASEVELCAEADLPLFYVDARTRRGQSGSPVVFFHSGGFVMLDSGQQQAVNAFTILLGVYSGRVNDESDIGRVWNRSAISEVLSNQ